MTAPNDLAAKLDEARKLIEAGWCQGIYGNAERGFCIWGAINKAVIGRAVGASPQTEPLERALGAAIGCHWTGLSVWNDAPERTQAEVIAAFRKAADLARAEMLA